MATHSDEQMLDLIVGTAEADDRIRAVILNGSRADPGAPRDPFQDFDVVYLVTCVAPFRDDPAWIDPVAPARGNHSGRCPSGHRERRSPIRRLVA